MYYNNLHVLFNNTVRYGCDESSEDSGAELMGF